MKNSLKGAAILLSLSLAPQAYAAQPQIDINKIIEKVKNAVTDQFTKFVCIAMRDCHQRIVYIANDSNATVTLQGCELDGKSVENGAEVYSAQKNSKGGQCVLQVYKDGQLDTEIDLNPKEKIVNYNKAGGTYCMTTEKVLKSWSKFPLPGRYEVFGYVAACMAT